MSIMFPPTWSQCSPTPYYTFYYDTGCSDEEEKEEQVLRNTVNSEALMTAFNQTHPGTNGNNVSRVSVFLCCFVLGHSNATIRVFVSEHGAGEAATLGGSFHRVWSRSPHVSNRQDPEAGRHGDPRVPTGGAVDDSLW